MCLFKRNNYLAEWEGCKRDNLDLRGAVELRDERIGELESEVMQGLETNAELEAKLKFDHSHWSTPLELPSTDVDLILLANLEHWNNGVFRWWMDNQYRLNTDEEIIEYIIWNDVDSCQYKPEFRDCDKFAGKFWGDYRWHTECNNCGFTVDWSGGHAYILFVRQNNAMWIYEPQNDKWYDTGSQPTFGNMYPLEQAGILL